MNIHTFEPLATQNSVVLAKIFSTNLWFCYEEGAFGGKVILNYQLFQKFKLLRYGKFNHLINTSNSPPQM